MTHTSFPVFAFWLTRRSIRPCGTSRALRSNKLHVLFRSCLLRLRFVRRILLTLLLLLLLLLLLRAEFESSITTHGLFIPSRLTSKELLAVLSSWEISSHGLFGGLGSSGDICIETAADVDAFISLTSPSGKFILCSSSSNRTTVCARCDISSNSCGLG